MQEIELILSAAENRSKLYWFIGTLFIEKPDKSLITGLSEDLPSLASLMLKNEIEALRRSLKTKQVSALIEQLEYEFTRLFRGIHNNYGPPPPYESLYRESTIMGDSTVSVLECYSNAGFGDIDKSTGPQDHLGVELKFIALLCLREALQIKSGKEAEAFYTLKMEKAFLDDHLLQWVPDYQSVVTPYTPHPFYEALISLTNRILVHDNEYITELLSENRTGIGPQFYLNVHSDTNHPQPPKKSSGQN